MKFNNLNIIQDKAEGILKLAQFIDNEKYMTSIEQQGDSIRFFPADIHSAFYAHFNEEGYDYRDRIIHRKVNMYRKGEGFKLFSRIRLLDHKLMVLRSPTIKL